jgi:hypothetical protein
MSFVYISDLRDVSKRGTVLSLMVGNRLMDSFMFVTHKVPAPTVFEEPTVAALFPTGDIVCSPFVLQAELLRGNERLLAYLKPTPRLGCCVHL